MLTKRTNDISRYKSWIFQINFLTHSEKDSKLKKNSTNIETLRIFKLSEKDNSATLQITANNVTVLFSIKRKNARSRGYGRKSVSGDKASGPNNVVT